MSARAVPGKALLGASLLLFVTLSGCFGFSSENDFEPGEDYKPTGKTIKLRSTVLDLLDKPVYPGLNVNAWAFCFKALDPEDQYSVDAVEYFPDQVVDVANPEWQGTCSMPGPTIRVNQGDKVIVQFENNHVHHHTIHWHGQYVPNHSDGVPGSTQDSVAPGDTFTYEFEAKRAGTLWYHCHVDTQLHVMQGLYDMFIVEHRTPGDNNYYSVLIAMQGLAEGLRGDAAWAVTSSAFGRQNYKASCPAQLGSKTSVEPLLCEDPARSPANGCCLWTTC